MFRSFDSVIVFWLTLLCNYCIFLNMKRWIVIGIIVWFVLAISLWATGTMELDPQYPELNETGLALRNLGVVMFFAPFAAAIILGIGFISFRIYKARKQRNQYRSNSDDS